jgi:hypothetical protein
MRFTEVIGRIAKLFEGKPRSRPNRLRSRPMVEALEDRTVPAVVWIGPVGGSNLWSNPLNWLDGNGTNHVPGAVDVVDFGTSFGGTNSSSVDNIANLTVAGVSCDNSFTSAITLGLTSGSPVTLTLGGGAGIADFNLDAGGTLNLNTGSSTASTTLNVGHDFWALGTVNLGANTLTSVGDQFQAEGKLALATIPQPNPTTVTSSVFVVSGALTVTSSAVLSTNTLQIAPGGTAAVSVMGSIVDTGLFTNAGAITLTKGTLVANQGLTNANTINTVGPDAIIGNVTNSGNITWLGALHNLNITGNYSGLGSLNMRINGAIPDANDTLRISGSASLSNGILNVTNIGGPIGRARGWHLIFAASIDSTFWLANLPAPLYQTLNIPHTVLFLD